MMTSLHNLIEHYRTASMALPHAAIWQPGRFDLVPKSHDLNRTDAEIAKELTADIGKVSADVAARLKAGSDDLVTFVNLISRRAKHGRAFDPYAARIMSVMDECASQIADILSDVEGVVGQQVESEVAA